MRYATHKLWVTTNGTLNLFMCTQDEGTVLQLQASCAMCCKETDSILSVDREVLQFWRQQQATVQYCIVPLPSQQYLVQYSCTVQRIFDTKTEWN